nr:DUF4952 domain-containing protein [uncultured Pseudomonas sp.]
MKRSHCFSWLLPLVLMLSSCSSLAEPVCTDFLASISEKPAFVEYLGCKQEVDKQGAPLTATYRVLGSSAIDAERYLQTTFGMEDLKRYCCSWDSTPHFFRDKSSGVGYLVGMASEETTIRTRELWREIEYFYINMSAYSEDP